MEKDMSKVQVHSTPSEKIIANKQAQIADHVFDAEGRVIKLRIPDALDEFDLSSALGENSTNVGVVGMATALLYVESIDGAPFLPPKTYEQVRAGIKRIGKEGLKAIFEAIQEYSKSASEQEGIEEIKK